MRAVGLQVLKNKLREYVRRATRGETILVTDRGRVVAELVPPRPDRSQVPGDAMLADAVRRGWLSPPLIASGDPPPRSPVASYAAIMRELKEDRDSG